MSDNLTEIEHAHTDNRYTIINRYRQLNERHKHNYISQQTQRYDAVKTNYRQDTTGSFN